MVLGVEAARDVVSVSASDYHHRDNAHSNDRHSSDHREKPKLSGSSNLTR